MSSETSLYPTSFTQERFWFLNEMVPGNPAYNIAFGVTFRGSLDRARLNQALNAIIERHEALRTRFQAHEGSPYQVIENPWTVQLAEEDLSHLDRSEMNKQVETIITKAAESAFDLSTLPLIRCQLFKLAKEEHLLFIVVHHIVFDGWSVGVFLRELAEHYQRHAQANQADMLPEIAIQYLDYAVWQKAAVQSEVVGQQLDFWKDLLKDAPVKLSFLTDYSRPAIQQFSAGRKHFQLGKELSERLTALACDNGATLFTSLLSVFQILVYKYTGKKDFLIGTPIANRQPKEIEELIGCFINMLPFRAALEDGSGFLDIVRKSQEQCLSLYANQDLPFDYLIRELRLPRDLSTSPLVQILFNFQNAAIDAVDAGDLHISQEKYFNGTTQYELTVEMWQRPDGLEGFFEYNSTLFRPETIERMTNHFLEILRAAVDSPEKAIAELPLLTGDEYQQLVVDYNDTAAAYPKDKGIHHLFEVQAEKTPDHTAAIFEDRQISYWELNARANQLAAFLMQKSVGAGTHVGICLNRSMDMLISMLAVLKSGASYIPLDPTYPKGRLEYMVEHSGLKMLLTDTQAARQFSDATVEAVLVSEVLTALTDQPTDNPVVAFNREAPAYTIYTSGSTGKPKGVVIPHRAATNFLLSMQKEPGITGDDVLLAVTTLSFDISVLEMFLPLISGATVNIVPQQILNNGFLLAEEIAESGATIMQATPASWRLLIDAGWQGSSDLKILCGGELLPPELAEALLQRGKSLWNLYGPTETTVWSAAYQVAAVDGPVSIGRPIDNTSVYILDTDKNPLPKGVEGELYIGGDGLALGYLHQDDMTAERFIDYERAGGRIYRTGDLAKFRNDGTVEIVGRIDHQVKIRGFRIELGEIESQLLAQEGVREAVVVARDNQQMDRRLAAYVVAEVAVPLSVEKIRAALTEKLPIYMVPADICQIDELPMTPNKKVDRKALPDPQSLIQDQEKTSDLEGETEEKLAEIWRSALGDMVISSSDNFFNLGGHSLLAMKVLAQVEKTFGLRISPQILVMQTLRQLARQCEAADRAEPREPANKGIGKRLFSKFFKT